MRTKDPRSDPNSNANSVGVGTFRWRLGSLVLLALALPACEARGSRLPPDAQTHFDTLNGVVHAVSGARGRWVAGGTWSVGEPTLTIGAADSPEEASFGAIGGVALGPDDGIYVADGRALEIRVFERNGSFRSRFGRQGRGPGEFQDISGIGFNHHGELAVLDGSLGRLSFFDQDGSFLRSIRLERPYTQVGRRPLWFDDAGRFYDRVNLSSAADADTMAVMVYEPDGAVHDTVFIDAEGAERRITATRGGRPFMGLRRPFTPEPQVAVGREGAIYASAGSDYRIAVLSPSGDTLRVYARQVEAPPVTDAERDAALADLRDRIREAGGTPPTHMELPDRKPAIQGLTVDSQGDLWVRAPMGEGWTRTEYGVFDPLGNYLGALTMMPMDVQEIGRDVVVGVATDSLGVQRVVLCPIQKPIVRF